jgi:hypothetical protein
MGLLTDFGGCANLAKVGGLEKEVVVVVFWFL